MNDPSRPSPRPRSTPRRPSTSRFPSPNGPRLPYLVYRATARDRWILRMLAEHRLLTGLHLQALAFTGVRVANRRLATLTGLGLLDRFRPPRALYGNQPWHYTLGPAGAQLIAAERAVTVSALGYQRTRLLAQAARPDLPHTVGCHDTLVHLALAGRGDDARLSLWWSAHSAQTVWGDLVRPDAYAVWQHTNTDGTRETCAFFYEYDTGSESIGQLLGKIPGYRRLRDQQDASHPILLHLPDHARETRVHAELAAHPPGVPIATTCTEATDLAFGAAIDAAVWLPAGAGQRVALARLPSAFTNLEHRLCAPVLYDRDVYAPAPLPDLGGR